MQRKGENSLDWNKIKTIFIITFLILDIFLFFQFIQKRNNSQLEIMVEENIEEQLAANKITHVDLPKEPAQAAYITGKSREFHEEETRSLKGQTVVLLDSKTIHSSLKDPIAIPKTDKGYFFEEFLRDSVLDGTKYKYWKLDEKEKKIYFFQQFKGKNIFHNQYAAIVADINEKNEIVSYTQTMLTDVKEMGGESKAQEIITATKALKTLYLKGEIESGSRVTKVELGYYTVVIPSSSGFQVIAPTWHFVLNGKDDYFVNAIEGQIIRMGKDNTQWSEVK
jgi:regulatory protein YycI of two-component signal transduction system YycFG